MQPNKPQTRNEKIKFLNDLQAGRISFADYSPQIFVWYLNDAGNEYKNKAGLVLTKEQFEALESNNMNIVIVYE